MSNSSKEPGGPYTQPDRSAVILVLGDIGDTTWRMFVPTIGLALGGSYLDGMWNTKPGCMLIGAAVGGVFAWLLVRKQLRRVDNG